MANDIPPGIGRRRSRSGEDWSIWKESEDDVDISSNIKASSPYFALRFPSEDISLSGMVQEQTAHDSAALLREEKSLFWWSLLLSSAASEVVVNLVLPCLVCSRHAGAWQPPSEWALLVVTLGLNLGGTFLEGFFRSIRLLSTTVRTTHKEHMLVFVTSEAFASGFLSVATSFPGVSGSGSGVPLGLNSLWFGAAFSLFNMLAGLLCYLWGSRMGRLSVMSQWSRVVDFCQSWTKVARNLVLASLLLPMAAAPTFAVTRAVGAGRSNRDRGSAVPLLPLDMVEPDLRPSLRWPLLAYQGLTLLEIPSFSLGLFIGVLMSVAGSAIAAYFCGAFFNSSARPAARLLANVTASALAYVARAIDFVIDRAEGHNAISSTSDFMRSKFISSFCGGLSAFAGTIGDIADAYFGSATEASSLDRESTSEKVLSKSSWRVSSLPRMPGVQNLLLHWALTLVVMWGCARFETWPLPVTPAPLPSLEQMPVRHIARSRAMVPWGALAPDLETEV